jgi:histidinol-phosphate aminotransferase
MTARLRPELAELSARAESKTIAGAIKLGRNETVFGPLPTVRGAIEQATDFVNRYPDDGNKGLRSRLAEHLNSSEIAKAADWLPKHIAVSGGSVSLCQQLIQITSTAGDEVLFGWRSFEIYPLQVRVAGAVSITVPLVEHALDLEAMLTAVTDRTRLIFVCNPNNPTSTVVAPQALSRFVAAVPSHILIAIDEAYVEYIRDNMRPNSLGLAGAHSNVVVLRTFSKAYGLAGLRVGYAIGDPDVIAALDKVRVAFTTTNISQAAASASLDAADELLARTDAVVAERARVSAQLRDAGFTLPPSQTNFVWLPLAEHTAHFVEQAANAGIEVRPYGSEGVRVTIGAPDENDALLRFAHDWITREVDLGATEL